MIVSQDWDGLVVLRMQHGPVNALDLELLRALISKFAELDKARAIVLTGNGRAFSAGVDLRRITEDGAAYVDEFLPVLTEAFMAVFTCSRPVVAAVDGHAIAGGCVLAAGCDRSFMAAGTIGLAELAVGVAFPAEALEIVRHRTGAAAAPLVLSASLLGPEEAHRVGLIDGVSAPDTLLDTALAAAQRLSQVPPAVFRMTKEQLHRPAMKLIEDYATADAAAARRIWGSDQVLGNISAYLDRMASASTRS